MNFLIGKKILFKNLSTNLLGEHNVQNLTAVLSIIDDLGYKIKKSHILSFRGTKRRMNILGKLNKTLFIDDYAHHPTEVKATIQAAKTSWERRILAVFQPHLFSRTRDFYKEFASSLELADYVILTDIYPARERPIPNISSKLIFDDLRKIIFLKEYFRIIHFAI